MSPAPRKNEGWPSARRNLPALRQFPRRGPRPLSALSRSAALSLQGQGVWSHLPAHHRHAARSQPPPAAQVGGDRLADRSRAFLVVRCAGNQPALRARLCPDVASHRSRHRPGKRPAALRHGRSGRILCLLGPQGRTREFPQPQKARGGGDTGTGAGLAPRTGPGPCRQGSPRCLRAGGSRGAAGHGSWRRYSSSSSLGNVSSVLTTLFWRSCSVGRPLGSISSW